MQKITMCLACVLMVSVVFIGCGDSTADNDCSDIESQMKTVNNKVAELENEIDSLNDQITECEESTPVTEPEKESECQCSAEDIQNLEQQLSQAQTELQTAQSDLTTALTEKESLQTEADKVPDLEANIKTLNSQITSLQSQNDALEAKYGASMLPQTFSGSGDTLTAPFEVPVGEWIIEWSYTTDSPEYASMYVRVQKRSDPDGSYVGKVATGDRTGRSESGSGYVYAGPGEYFLDVSEANIASWRITVKKP